MPVEGGALPGARKGKSVGASSGVRGSGGRVSAIVAKESFELADEKKFHALRKRLTDEGYTQVLGFESVPLVHRLFDDMCALQDTHATLAHNLSEKSANEAKLQRQIHPVQKELSRMVRENNQLHLELIQRGEELETHHRQGSLETKKLQTKIADQAFIITQQAQHIRDLEQQVDQHRQRIEELLDPNFTYTSGPAGETLPKGQEIMVSACPRPHDVQLDDEFLQQVNHDLESATAKHIAVLEEDLKESRRKEELLEVEVSSLKEAIRNRENEILRMGRLLVNNVNSDREDLEKINSNNEDSIRRLNSQLDFVSGQLADAEQQKVDMQQLSDEVERLRRNEAKLKEMLATAQGEMQDLRSVLAQQSDDSMENYVVDKKGVPSDGLVEMLDRMSCTMHLLCQLQLKSKQQQWTAIFKGFDKNGDHTISRSEFRQALQKAFKPVAEEDAALLFDVFDSDASGQLDIREFHAKTGETNHEPTRRALVRELVKRAQLEIGGAGRTEDAVSKDREGQKRQHSRSEAVDKPELSLQVDALEASLQQRESECAKLREQVVLSQQQLSDSQSRCAQVGAELSEMKRLRDNLYAVVWDFENQMAEVQAKIKELVSAREEKSRECAEAWERIKVLEQAASGARHPSGVQGAASSSQPGHVAQLLDELQTCRKRVQNLEAQVEKADNELANWAARDEARGQSTSGGMQDSKLALETALAATQQELQDVKAEHSRLVKEHAQLAEKHAPMEAKVMEKERAIEQLQSLMSSMDETRGQVVSQLKVHMESSQAGKRKTELLEAEVKRLLAELRRLEDELALAKSSVSDIDAERDNLLNQLDEKTQMVRALEGRLGEALREHDTSLADVTSIQQQADMLRQALNERDAHNKALQQEVHTESNHRKNAEQLCNAKMEEARILAADLGTMTRENQVVNDELAVVVTQRDALKRDLDEALQRLAVAQQLVQGREREKQDILMSYRALNEEKQRADAGTDRVTMELHEVRAQVYAREEELMRARESISSLEQEQQRAAIDMLGLQRHSDLVSEKLVDAQERVKQEAADREALAKELASCKNVAALVEKQKLDAVREGALLRDEIIALRNKISSLTAEKDLMRAQQEAEKAKVRDLEDLLQALRAKEHAALSAEQAAAADSVGLHQRLQTALSENELNAQELRLLRSQREELEYELEKHRRLVSHESMDRESAASELTGLKTNVRELSVVVDKQNSALQAKHEELSLQKDRLQKIQAEAEANERRVRELDTRLRMSEDANKALQASARQHDANLEQSATEKSELRAALRRTEEQLDKMHSQYKQVKDSEKEHELRVAGLSAEKDALAAQRDALSADLDQARSNLSARTKEVETVTELLEKMDGEYRALQDKVLEQYKDAPRTP